MNTELQIDENEIALELQKESQLAETIKILEAEDEQLSAQMDVIINQMDAIEESNEAVDKQRFAQLDAEYDELADNRAALSEELYAREIQYKKLIIDHNSTTKLIN